MDLFLPELTIFFSLLDALLTGQQFGNVRTMNHSPGDGPRSQVVSLGPYGSIQQWTHSSVPSLVHELGVSEPFWVSAKTQQCLNVYFISFPAEQSSSKNSPEATGLFVDQISNESLGWETRS